MTKLSSDNPAVKYSYDSEKVYICDEGIYYNPTSIEMQKLILNGIKEIVTNYDVDGIHIDDYFYPTTETKIDATAYDRYIDAGGESALDEWRVWNVNSLISGIYSTVKSVDKNVIVSISPSGDINKNLTKLYADTKEWMCNVGYCDWIVPQLYFGFHNEYLPFEEALSEWLNLCKNPKCKIIIGLACYKCNEKDTYAGNGEDEWVNDGTVLKRQIQILKEKKVYGYALFSYKYVIQNCNLL
ncbi:hypothetical protein SDC9_136514 [bioreactor metagenome]|uniref:Glycosyl hydrolase-like 10 domain-containing protein n=1 Tax=bioreactor metagenome TaxID=1076179 RepID=A0A645DJH4_9ZZZZ